NLASHEAYDPASNRWEHRAPMPTARSGIAAAVLEGRMFVLGGEAPAGTFNQVQAYDDRSNGWSNHARMPTGRHGLGAAAVAGRVYVVSGGPTPGGSGSGANESFVPGGRCRPPERAPNQNNSGLSQGPVHLFGGKLT